MTPNFAMACLDVHNKILSDPEVAAMVEAAEEERGQHSPMNQVGKLHLVAKLAKGTENLRWALSSIFDSVRAKVHSAGSFGVRLLKGARAHWCPCPLQKSENVRPTF